MRKDKWLNLFKLNVEYLLKLKNFSTCKYVKVAAVLCQKKSLKIVSLGWNGTPPKVLECNEAHDMILKILEKHITTGHELKFCAKIIIIDYSQKYSLNVLIDKYSPLIIKAVENVMKKVKKELKKETKEFNNIRNNLLKKWEKFSKEEKSK